MGEKNGVGRCTVRQKGVYVYTTIPPTGILTQTTCHRICILKTKHLLKKHTAYLGLRVEDLLVLLSNLECHELVQHPCQNPRGPRVYAHYMHYSQL